MNYLSFITLIMPFFLLPWNYFDCRGEKQFLFVFSLLLFKGKNDHKLLTACVVGFIFCSIYDFQSSRAFFQSLCVAASVSTIFSIEYDGKIKIFYKAVGLVAFLLVIWMTLEIFYVYPSDLYASRDADRFIGPLGNFTLTGALLAATSQVFWSDKRLYPLAIISGAILFYWGSSMSLGAWLLASIWHLHWHWRVGFYFWSVVSLFYLPTKWLDAQERLPLWKNIFKNIEWSPIGQGFGWLPDKIDRYAPSWGLEHFRNSHNDYIEAWYALGLIGFLLALYVIIKAFLQADKLSQSLMIAILSNSVGNFTLHQTSISLILIIIVGYWFNKQRGFLCDYYLCLSFPSSRFRQFLRKRLLSLRLIQGSKS